MIKRHLQQKIYFHIGNCLLNTSNGSIHITPIPCHVFIEPRYNLSSYDGKSIEGVWYYPNCYQAGFDTRSFYCGVRQAQIETPARPSQKILNPVDIPYFGRLKYQEINAALTSRYCLRVFIHFQSLIIIWLNILEIQGRNEESDLRILKARVLPGRTFHKVYKYQVYSCSCWVLATRETENNHSEDLQDDEITKFSSDSDHSERDQKRNGLGLWLTIQ